MKLRYHPLTLLILALVTATACTPKVVDSEAIVTEKYQERTGQLTENLLTGCREDIMKEANRRADSLLIDRARRMRRIEGRPPRPNRPGAPPVKQLSAPLPLRPLFPFEIRFDTLLRDSLLLDSLRLDSVDRGLMPLIPIEEL